MESSRSISDGATARSFAVYRRPYQKQCTLIVDDTNPETVDSAEDIGNRSGFVIAPFDTGADKPIVLIKPGKLYTFADTATLAEDISANVDLTGLADIEPCCAGTGFSQHRGGKDSYCDDFARFHEAVLSGRFEKLVLARGSDTPSRIADGLMYFCNACRHYPRVFVALWYTPQTGMWLVTTPEVLIENTGDDYHTMALAGTMRLDDVPDFDLHDNASEVKSIWSAKNIEEQAIVARYIGDRLAVAGITPDVSGPYTVRAANLLHLCTDFRFKSRGPSTTGMLLSLLHPTPAVCGIPTAEAKDFIRENESRSRSYYSGFCGPVGIDSYTGIYVTLRCMEIHPGYFTAYAGGGILPESTLEGEWMETEAKLQTINDIIY